MPGDEYRSVQPSTGRIHTGPGVAPGASRCFRIRCPEPRIVSEQINLIRPAQKRLRDESMSTREHAQLLTACDASIARLTRTEAWADTLRTHEKFEDAVVEAGRHLDQQAQQKFFEVLEAELEAVSENKAILR